ncbi:MAG: ribose-phosphate pyrophosphokinase [Candidatus Hydrogenedentota bacterium]
MAYSRNVKVFSGTASQALTEGVCKYLEIPPGRVLIGEFSDGEIKLQVHENIRGSDVFIINSTSPPVNRNIMELLIFIDAAKRASVDRVTAVIPYYGYARQDRKDRPRVPITAKLVSNLLVAAGVDRVLTVDLHCGQIQGFFDIPVDHLSGDVVFVNHLLERGLNKNTVVVSPDTGSVARIRDFARRLEVPLAIIDKRRPKENESEVMNVIGEVEGLHAIIFDDMIDTGGTLVKAAQAIKNLGAIDVIACSTHGVFSGSAIERIQNSVLDEVLVSDSIPLSEAARQCTKIKVLSIAPLVGEAIRRIHQEESVSILFR